MINLLFSISVIVSILSFGAVPDGTTDNATAINKAIEFCHKKGRGIVVVPPGEFATGSIHLRSGVTLRLDEGATLKGVQDLRAYTPLRTTADLSRYDSGLGTANANSASDSIWSLALIHIEDAANVAITGRGTIDGGHLLNPLGEERQRGPHAILIANAYQVGLEGISIKRAANYAILAYSIDKAIFSGLNIEEGWDGIHIRGGRHVIISDCRLATGDDAIAGGYWDRMVISRCDINSSCNGIRMIQPSTRLKVERCRFHGPGRFPHRTSGKTASDAAISLEPGGWGPAPGRMDHILLKDLYVETMLTPLSVTLSDDNSLGRLRVENLTARDITRMALSVKSWGRARAERVAISHADLQFRGIDDPTLPKWFDSHTTDQWPVFPSYGLYFRNVDRVELRDVRTSFTGRDYRQAMATEHVGKIRKKDVGEAPPSPTVP